MNEHTLPSGSESLALPTDLVGDEISISPSELRSLGDRFQKFHLEYRFALQEVETKLDILREEFLHMHEYHPIEHVSSRVKSIDSLLAKVERRGISPDIDTIRREVRDIAGVRVTCAFRRDVYKLFDLLTQQDDVTVLEVEDYIVDPKPNGYKSLHAIISVPVFLSSGRVDVPVEVQFRTIAMDFWASLEHKIYYKYQRHVPDGLIDELRSAAVTASELDERMERLHTTLHGVPTETTPIRLPDPDQREYLA
ncbi:GTP pyrophosphokinase family protein [Leucobacter sp. cx-42]|uniref:GTP pyrophosphokinase n=1 Tax=unclassified Leucobacter TaxID=2621730 RepID=UPI00165E9BEB|nr:MULTISPECIES: GTP pyrophosphokinase family protein [unclassified Leucobacter]MBC9953323.1 GTP pyrophosphokinase family protein [Leucobacter sp. cx-42]